MIRALTLWLLAGLVAGPAFAAKLLVQVDNAEPELGEVFAVHLTLVDGRADGPPPLEILYRDDRVIAVDLCGRGDRLVVGSTARPFANLTATLFPTAEQLGGDLPGLCAHICPLRWRLSSRMVDGVASWCGWPARPHRRPGCACQA